MQVAEMAEFTLSAERILLAHFVTGSRQAATYLTGPGVAKIVSGVV